MIKPMERCKDMLNEKAREECRKALYDFSENKIGPREFMVRLGKISKVVNNLNLENPLRR